ncbi:MAG: hypothetical protein NUW23_03035 [Firmicutes bacterium]|nr:hypothetical protein [Bacillota bacterium]
MDVLLDTNVIIDLIALACLARVLEAGAFRFWIVESVRQEVTDLRQRAILEEQLQAGAIRQTRVDDIEELKTYVELRTVSADGEAASIAAAVHQGWAFATYEKGRTEREALRRLGRSRYLRTPCLLAAAIQAGTMTLEDLDMALATLPSGLPKDEKTPRRLAHLKTLRNEVLQILGIT